MDKQEEEIWKDIPGYEGYYQVSSFGRVKSLHRIIPYMKKTRVINERILKLRNEPNRYSHLCLAKNGRNKYFHIHQVVAMAFLGHRPDFHKLVINHIDGNGLNNELSNLEIVTTRENHSTCFRKNAKKFSSKYIGVTLEPKTKKWRSAIRINGKKKHLGSYNSEVEASWAYQEALLLIKNQSNG